MKTEERDLFSPYTLTPITKEDDAEIAQIIRSNLEQFHLDIPGTVYFDESLDHLSEFYKSRPDERGYLILKDEEGRILGGVGIAEFEGFADCAELQKIYLVDEAKGKGLGRKLLQEAEHLAKSHGYKKLYLETHTNLEVAIKMYEKTGFEQIEKPEMVCHGTMNRFFLKELS